MGNAVTTVGNNAGVYAAHKSQYMEAEALEGSIEALKDQIANDDNLTPKQKKEFIAELEKGDQCADRAQDLTSTTRKKGRRDDKDFDKNNRVINNNINAAENSYYKVLSGYADTQKANEVAEPTPPPQPATAKGATLSDDVDAPVKTSKTGSTSNRTNIETLKTDSAEDIALKMANGELKLSGSELNALASSDPGKFNDLINALVAEGEDVMANTVQNQLQNHLQKTNRMFSLMANLNQALHDTQKALINNIRV